MKKLLLVLALLGAIVCCNENVLASTTNYQKPAYQQQQKKKFNPVSYCYGQMYKAYLNNGKKADFKVQMVQAQKYAGIFIYFKKQGFADDVKIGKTLEDATVIYVKGFNETAFKAYNPRYANAIEKKIAKK